RTHLPRPLPANESPDRQAPRRQGRPGRPRPPTRRSDLAHAHPSTTLRSQRRHRPPGRLTALKETRHRSEPQSALSSNQEAIERERPPPPPPHPPQPPPQLGLYNNNNTSLTHGPS